MKNISDLRNEYSREELSLESISKSPFDQFKKWFNEALTAELMEPNAMILSTVSETGMPFQRTVLLKAYDQKGFVFYTNYNSRKAKQIDASGKASLLFPWYGLERQVCISGTTTRVSTQQSLKYFLSRPHGSQLGAWVSQQSSVISSRSILDTKLSEMKRKFKEGKVPFPDFWGGYRIEPVSIEFWQGRPNRLHDRIYYEKEDGDWAARRLAP